MIKRFWAMTKARLLEVARDRTAMFWQMLFVPALIAGVAIVMSGAPQPLFTVGVLGDAPLTRATHPFLGAEATRFYHEQDQTAGLNKLRRQSTDLLLDPRSSPARYWINTDSTKGRILQSLLVQADPGAQRQEVAGEPIRYADWLVPGMVGVNIMFSSLLGIGYVIVRYRKTGYLKRLNGTPLRAVEFVGAQLAACLILTVLISAGIYGICKAALHLQVAGSYLNLLVVVVVGAAAMIAMSLPVAARIASEEVAAGILNLLAWPMLLLSGVFFSLDAAPESVRALGQLFPLTHMLSAARAVIIDGAGFTDLLQPLAVMLAMTALFLAVGAGLFRWSQE